VKGETQSETSGDTQARLFGVWPFYWPRIYANEHELKTGRRRFARMNADSAAEITAAWLEWFQREARSSGQSELGLLNEERLADTRAAIKRQCEEDGEQR
jgi:hypothetical protein